MVGSTLEEIPCPYCGSRHTIKDGTRQNINGTKQKFKCMNCKRYFSKIPYNTPKHIIDFALLKVKFGLSLRATSSLLRQKYDLSRCYATIGNWVKQRQPEIRKSIECDRRCTFSQEGYCQLQCPPLTDVGGIYICSQQL